MFVKYINRRIRLKSTFPDFPCRKGRKLWKTSNMITSNSEGICTKYCHTNPLGTATNCFTAKSQLQTTHRRFTTQWIYASSCWPIAVKMVYMFATLMTIYTRNCPLNVLASKLNLVPNEEIKHTKHGHDIHTSYNFNIWVFMVSCWPIV